MWAYLVDIYIIGVIEVIALFLVLVIKLSFELYKKIQETNPTEVVKY